MMNRATIKYYPGFWQAVNLIVLYTFLQTLIDFPLALYDYQFGTDWLQEPLLKLPVFFATTLIILWLGNRFSGRPVQEIYPMKLFHWLNLPAVLLALIGLQFFMNQFSQRFDELLPPPDWFLELFRKLFESDFGILGGIVRVVILAPVVEELIFRGVIFSGFQKNYRPWLAIFYSALLFALFHLNPWQFGPTFLLGLLLGLVRLQTGSLLAAVFTHALHNGMIFFSVYYHGRDTQPSWLQTGEPLQYLANLLLVAAGIFLILHAGRKAGIRPQANQAR